MNDSVRMLILLSSPVIAVWLWLRVGLGIRKSSIEHYASKLLLMADLVNNVGGACLLCAYGVLSAWRAFDPDHVPGVQILTAMIAWILPARVIWSLVHAKSGVIRRYRLQPWPPQAPRSRIEDWARLIGVAAPTLMVSPRLSSPIVFGRRSRNAIMAIPSTWIDDATTDRNAVILHELAHLKNRDIGITAWSHAFSRDRPLAIVLCATLALLAWLTSRPGWAIDVQAATLYGVCVLHVAVLSVIVRRDRERLADRTVALLLRDPALADHVLRETLTTYLERESETPRRSARSHLMCWLGDRAVAGRYSRISLASFALMSSLYSSHPSVMERTTKAVREANRLSSLRNLPLLTHCIWAGSACGLMSILLGIAGLTFERHVLGITDPDRALAYFANLIMATALPMGAVFSLLFALPAWSAARPVVFENRYLGALLLRYTAGVIAAAGTCAIVLLPWGESTLNVLSSFAWLHCCMALASAFIINLLLVSMWLVGRFWRRHMLADMMWVVFWIGPGVLIGSTLLGLGLARTLPEQPIRAALMAVAFVMGLAGCMCAVGRSSVSSRDLYLVHRIAGYWDLRYEGRGFIWPGMFMASVVAAAIISGIGVAVFIGLDRLLGLSYAESELLVLLLLLFTCGILIVLSRVRTPWSISQLVHSQATLCRLLAALQSEHRTVPGMTLAQTPAHAFRGSLVSEMLFDWADVLIDQPIYLPWMNKAIGWLANCETTSGFGLWPGSCPRLRSTYHALELFRRVGQQPCNAAEEHARWIQSLQCRDGSFKGPFSRRLPVEDTFFAVQSLAMLGHPLAGSSRERCAVFAKGVASAALTQDNSAEDVFHAFETLRLLDALTAAEVRQFQAWALRAVRALALEGVAYTAEPLLCAVRVLRACPECDSGEQVSSDLLWGIADRASHALEIDRKPLALPWANECLDTR